MKKIIIGVVLVGVALVSMSSLVFHHQINNETFSTGKTVKKLSVDDRNMPLEVVGVSSNYTKIHYSKGRGIKYRIKQTSDSLRLERQKSFGFNFDFFNFGNNNAKVTIEIPKTDLKELQLETTNGKISAKNLTLENLDLETTNSKLTVHDVTAQTIDAETTNGKVDLSQLTFSEGSFETSNSKMDLAHLTFKEGDFQTSNGKINLLDLKPSDALSLKTSNAKVNGTIIGDREDFSMKTKTSNGSNNLGNHTSGSKELEVRTSNGDIEIIFVD